MLEPVFNDLSAEPLAINLAAAFERMSRLIGILRAAPDHGLDLGFRIPQTFHHLLLCPEYRIWNWLHDERVPREQTLFLLTLATRSPYLDESPDAIMDRALLVDVRINGRASEALRAGYLLEAPLLSFLETPWDNAFIDCECVELVKDTLTLPHPLRLPNLSDVSHFGIHADWIRDRRRRSVSSMRDLWNHRGMLFRHLDFCPSVEGQLMILQPNEPRFQQVVNKLFHLEDYFAGWSSGAFDPTAFARCHPASTETLQRYPEDYRYVTADGQEVVASWHLYFTPGKGRLYFAADDTNRRGIVCHGGDKLPDTTYGRT